MLVTFCLVVCRVREKRVAEALGMVEKRWREEEEMGGKF